MTGSRRVPMSLCPHGLISHVLVYPWVHVLVSPCSLGLMSTWPYVPMVSCPKVLMSQWPHVHMYVLTSASPWPHVPCPCVRVSTWLHLPMVSCPMSLRFRVSMSPCPHVPMCPHVSMVPWIHVLMSLCTLLKGAGLTVIFGRRNLNRGL